MLDLTGLSYPVDGAHQFLTRRVVMVKTRKLSDDDWRQLSNLMENVPDPETTLTVTDWHYELRLITRRHLSHRRLTYSTTALVQGHLQ